MEVTRNGESKETTLKSPILPWKTRIAISVINSVTDAACRRDGTVNRRLLKLLDFRSPPNSRPVNDVSSRDVTVDPSRNLWFRVFKPVASSATSSTPLPVVVFFHGGGFVFLSPDARNYDAVCRRFARRIPAVVVSVNYRLAPEHRFPAQYDDGFDVLKFLDDGGAADAMPNNADLSRCFIAGDSAGGNLSHHVTKRFAESRSEFNRLKVIGLVTIQPFFGGEERTETEIKLAALDLMTATRRTDWMWKAFLPPGQGLDRDHEVINVSGPKAANISELDFPATLVFISGFDLLKDWQKRYYEWLKKSGKEAYLVDFPNMVHAFYVFPELPESAELISEVKDFVHKQCSKLGA